MGFTYMRAYAEFVVSGVDGIVTKPPSMPWEEAGVLSAAGQTAHIALSKLEVDEGDTMLVHAAAGALAPSRCSSPGNGGPPLSALLANGTTTTSGALAPILLPTDRDSRSGCASLLPTG